MNPYQDHAVLEILSGRAAIDYAAHPVLRRPTESSGVLANPLKLPDYVTAGPVGPGYWISAALDPDGQAFVTVEMLLALGLRAHAQAVAAATWRSPFHDGRVSRYVPFP